MRAKQENNFKRTPNSERMDTENIQTLSPGIGMFSAQLFDGTISSADLQAEELQINKYIYIYIYMAQNNETCISLLLTGVGR